MKANANQIRAALEAPSPDIRLYLLHGPDEAGAQDLAARLARSMGPEAERVDLDGATLKSDPGRLADEAASISLFGGARHIRVTGAGEECFEAFTLLLETERAGNPVLAIGPGLKATGKVLKLALASPSAMTFACYVPEGAAADQIAVAIAREQGLRPTGDTAHRIATAAGGDRAVMARELEKIALYLDAALDRPREIDDAALDAIGADLGDGEMWRSIDAAIDGRAADVASELARLGDVGTLAIPLLRQLVRRLMTLAELRGEIDAGAGVGDVVERHRIFFREKASTTRALRRWQSARLADAIAHVRGVERQLIGSGTAGGVLAEAALLGVARIAAR
ncbi:DNA polymerase III subunit delta [soil metagenome]